MQKKGSVAILIHRTEPTPEFGAECCFKKEPNREDTIEILQAVIRHHRKIAMLGLVGLLAASIWLQ